MFNRYNKTQKIINNSEIYENVFKNKKIEFPLQYGTFNFENLNPRNLFSFDRILHTVEPGDRLYTISQKYYNSPEYGWLICYTNNYSNEMLIKINSTLTIYVPLQSLLGLL